MSIAEFTLHSNTSTQNIMEQALYRLCHYYGENHQLQYAIATLSEKNPINTLYVELNTFSSPINPIYISGLFYFKKIHMGFSFKIGL